MHHHGIEEKFPGGFQTNFERDIKRVVQSDQFTDEVQSGFGELAKRYKAGLRLFLFLTESLALCPFYVLEELRQDGNE